jgi:2-methylcitrate dehydratase PrpD
MTSALLAAEGIEATPTALTGRAGLFRAYGRADKDYASRLVEQLGSHYEIESVTFKPYPGGQFHRGVIRGFVELRERVSHDAIETAHVHMHPFEANYLGLAYKGPFSTYSQAFFSVPFCAALASVYGTVTFAGLHRFDDRAVLSFVARTNVVSDESRERYKPLIRVILKDGSTFEWLDTAGEEGYELTWSAATAMVTALYRESHCAERSGDALIDSVTRIQSMQTIAPLIAAAKSALGDGGKE